MNNTITVDLVPRRLYNANVYAYVSSTGQITRLQYCKPCNLLYSWLSNRASLSKCSCCSTQNCTHKHFSLLHIMIQDGGCKPHEIEVGHLLRSEERGNYCAINTMSKCISKRAHHKFLTARYPVGSRHSWSANSLCEYKHLQVWGQTHVWCGSYVGSNFRVAWSQHLAPCNRSCMGALGEVQTWACISPTWNKLSVLNLEVIFPSTWAILRRYWAATTNRKNCGVLCLNYEYLPAQVLSIIVTNQMCFRQIANKKRRSRYWVYVHVCIISPAVITTILHVWFISHGAETQINTYTNWTLSVYLSYLM